MTELPRPGQRIGLRYRDDSGPRELVGYVREAGPEGLAMLDRTLTPRLLGWDRLESWRVVPQVPRGRNPAAADPALLDRMAADQRLALPEGVVETGVGDDCLVARLCDLLGPGVPDQGPEAYDLGDGLAERRLDGVWARAIAVGEWSTIRIGVETGDWPDPHGAVREAVVGLARWAAYRDARNLQVRGVSLALAGFTRLTRR